MAPTQTPSETTLILSNPSKWYRWISDIKTSAILTRTWDLIDPSLLTEPVQPSQPIRPSEEELERYLEENKDSLVAMKLSLYNSKEREYFQKIQCLSAIMTQIRKSISNDYAIHIEGKENPYQALRALKLQIEPDSFTRAMKSTHSIKLYATDPPGIRALHSGSTSGSQFTRKQRPRNMQISNPVESLTIS